MIRDCGPLSEMGISNPYETMRLKATDFSEPAECGGRAERRRGLQRTGDQCFSSARQEAVFLNCSKV